MHTAWRFIQICLAGAFVLAAATMGGGEAEQSRAMPTPIITALADIETKVRKPTITVPTAKVRDLIAAAQEMTSLEDFKKFPLSAVEGELLESVQSDEFSHGNPFDSMNNVYPIALMLEKGVNSFRRDAYRSPQFIGGLGYDVVKYEIYHPDESKSYILAYKEKTGPDQLAVGKKDKRPVFSMFIVPHDQEQVYMSLYQNGLPQTNQVMNTQQALAQINDRVDPSTPLLSSRDK